MGSLLLGAASVVQAHQPNIIVILSDDMGYSDIGCYGGIIDTPHLDGLAENGLRYTQFYNTARSCPSRASLLTGLHPHQAGMGHMTDDRGMDGYRGEIGDNCVTIAEVLKPAGYNTMAVGKWHIARGMASDGPKYNWPLQRGFDSFYGTIMGGGSFYDPATLCRGNEFITPANDPEYRPTGTFYYTDAIADNAVMFLEDHFLERGEEPFFMYAAFTAAHWPMQVPEDDIAPYYGRFDAGWDELRRRKYDDMVSRGIVREEWALSHDPSVESWTDCRHKEFETRCMEVYAGMITNLDRNIGKIVDALTRNGQLDNTIIIYLQDNGGCAEPMQRNQEPFMVKVPEGENMLPMEPDELQTRLIPFKTRDGKPVWQGRVQAGGNDTYIGYGKKWAYLSNTPFREYKHWVHEGGISTPLIIHWPERIISGGEMRRYPGQLMDIMATCIDVSGADYPMEYRGNSIAPYEGRSLAPTFHRDDSDSDRLLFWEHEGNRAVRSGKWKLVFKGDNNVTRDIALYEWELYDMDEDRTETDNIAAGNQEVVKELAARWEEFAVRCRVKPWPSGW